MSLSDVLAAAEAAAASVYHDALELEPVVVNWTTNHPEVGPLIEQAAGWASSLLGGAGSAGASIGGALGSLVLAEMKGLAARDATVPSLPQAEG